MEKVNEGTEPEAAAKKTGAKSAAASSSSSTSIPNAMHSVHRVSDLASSFRPDAPRRISKTAVHLDKLSPCETRLQSFAQLLVALMDEVGFEPTTYDDKDPAPRAIKFGLCAKPGVDTATLRLTPAGPVFLVQGLYNGDDSTPPRTYTTARLAPSGFVDDPAGESLFSRYKNLGELSVEFKNEVAIPLAIYTTNAMSLGPPTHDVARLPPEVKVKIAGYVPRADRSKLARTSKAWKATCKMVR